VQVQLRVVKKKGQIFSDLAPVCPEPAYVEFTSAGKQDISTVAMTDGNKKLPEGSFFVSKCPEQELSTTHASVPGI